MSLEGNDPACGIKNGGVSIFPSSDEQPRLVRVVQGIDVDLVLVRTASTHITLSEYLRWKLYWPLDDVQ